MSNVPTATDFLQAQVGQQARTIAELQSRVAALYATMEGMVPKQVENPAKPNLTLVPPVDASEGDR